MRSAVVSSIRRRFQRLSQSQGQVTHVLLTRSPLISAASCTSPFDLHVLSTPPAFVLSQDQTLRKCSNAHAASNAAHSVSTQPPETRNQTNESNLTEECQLTSKSIQRNPNQPTNRPDEVIGIDNCARC